MREEPYILFYRMHSIEYRLQSAEELRPVPSRVGVKDLVLGSPSHRLIKCTYLLSAQRTCESNLAITEHICVEQRRSEQSCQRGSSAAHSYQISCQNVDLFNSLGTPALTKHMVRTQNGSWGTRSPKPGEALPTKAA